MTQDLPKSTTEARFSLQLPNPWVAGIEDKSMQWFSSTQQLSCKIQDEGTEGTRVFLRLYPLWGTAWHDTWEQSLSSPSMRNRFVSKMNHILNVFYAYVQAWADGRGWGLHQRHGANSMAPSTGLSIRRGSALDGSGQILQEAPQISTLSSKWICKYSAWWHLCRGEAGKEMFFVSHLCLLTLNIQ